MSILSSTLGGVVFKHPAFYIIGGVVSAATIAFNLLSDNPSGSTDPVRVGFCTDIHGDDYTVIFHEPIERAAEISEGYAYFALYGEDRLSKITGDCTTALCFPDDPRHICGVVRWPEPQTDDARGR